MATKIENRIDEEQRKREQFRNEIRMASNKRILRKQLELLAEVSHSEIDLGLPELTNAMLDIHDRLEKSKPFFAICILVMGFNFFISIMIFIKHLFWR